MVTILIRIHCSLLPTPVISVLSSTTRIQQQTTAYRSSRNLIHSILRIFVGSVYKTSYILFRRRLQQQQVSPPPPAASTGLCPPPPHPAYLLQALALQILCKTACLSLQACHSFCHSLDLTMVLRTDHWDSKTLFTLMRLLIPRLTTSLNYYQNLAPCRLCCSRNLCRKICRCVITQPPCITVQPPRLAINHRPQQQQPPPDQAHSCSRQIQQTYFSTTSNITGRPSPGHSPCLSSPTMAPTWTQLTRSSC